jgi:hypothetical protein
MEVHFVIVTTFITSQSAYADSSPQGEPLSIITFEKSRKQFIALQVEIRSRYFGNGPNKDFYVVLHNKEETRGSLLSTGFYIAIELNYRSEISL